MRRPRDIQWSRVNDSLPERAEKTGNILHMSRLSQSHNGTYLCQAHNNYGRAADHYTLLVYGEETHEFWTPCRTRSSFLCFEPLTPSQYIHLFRHSSVLLRRSVFSLALPPVAVEDAAAFRRRAAGCASDRLVNEAAWREQVGGNVIFHPFLSSVPSLFFSVCPQHRGVSLLPSSHHSKLPPSEEYPKERKSPDISPVRTIPPAQSYRWSENTSEEVEGEGHIIIIIIIIMSDPGAVVETHSAVPYAVIGGILALLVFTVICVLIVTIWCSVRQKGSYLTHEASGLDEHGEVQEAFLNGNEASQGKKEYLL
ncbi:hypothetical protein DNTS_021607 [Danionella cerebrum]|uniref:Neurexin/syndecan/glycophorin C domain-containing protein n=1 Tax=Danionella cerebrum TaxID=2873325 RepID=A0A553QXM8_9TELE|nr:hypothetical protein DNTS_021607 [Danionella translucida]